MGNHTSDRYAVSTKWEKSREFKLPFDYVLGLPDEEQTPENVENPPINPATGEPHQVCQVRRLDMGDLIKLGIAEELDFMSKALIEDDKKQDGEQAKEAVGRAIMKADNYNRMEKMVNLVVGSGVLQPTLNPAPVIKERDSRTGEVIEKPNEAARQKGLLYVDHLPWDDRMELFATIFETEGLSTFRQEQTPGVGDVEHESSVQLPADGPVDVRSDDTEGVLLQ